MCVRHEEVRQAGVKESKIEKRSTGGRCHTDITADSCYF